MHIPAKLHTAFKCYQSGNLKQAVSICENILKENPEEIAVLHFLGVVYQQLQNYDASIKYLERVLQLDSNSFEGFYNLGNAFESHSAAILSMMGITETIASTTNEYVSLAVKLGNDSDLRRNTSGKIADNKHRVYRDRTCITTLLLLKIFLRKR